MKHIKRMICVLFFALLLPSLAFGAAHDLVIYHTNDSHGYMLETRDGDGRLANIGFDRLKAVADADPSARKLLLDAGDVLHGQSFATARRGDLPALVLSMAGYDGLAVGNHEFDYGQERLLELVNKYRLNFLAANVVNQKGAYILPPYFVRAYSDLKVGIFGLSTPATRTSTNPKNIEGLEILDPIETARMIVKQLKSEGADLIIALTHMGSEDYCNPSSLTIAKEAPGIDIIIDGHSHSKVDARVRRQGGVTLVASSGSALRNIGRVTVDRKPGGGFEISGTLLSATDPRVELAAPDPAMQSAMTALKAEFDKEMGVVVMKAPFALDGSRERVRGAGTNLGRIICAGLMESTGADAAILNGGSVRGSIPEGDVTKGELLSVLPYGNLLCTVEVSGADLLDAMNLGLSEIGSGAFPQFWGMEVAARPEGNGFAAESITIGGKPLDPGARYTLAINDFMAAGGDGYDMFKQYEYHEFETLEEAFRQFVTAEDPETLKAISDTENLKVK